MSEPALGIMEHMACATDKDSLRILIGSSAQLYFAA